MPTPLLAGTHAKPFPDKDPMCPGGRASRGLVLGTDFFSDVLLIRLTVSDPVTLRPSYLSSQVALRTVAEALTIAAAKHLQIEASELQAEFRPALTQWGGRGREAEIYLYDTLSGGAGFTQQVSQLGRKIFELALERLVECPAQCEESCYRCLRSFRNRFEHTQLDRHVGASLLRYLLDGTLPELSPARVDRSVQRLFEDLDRSGADDVHFERDAQVDIDGIEKPVMHACGHDVHITSLVGAARQMAARKLPLVVVFEGNDAAGKGETAVAVEGDVQGDQDAEGAPEMAVRSEEEVNSTPFDPLDGSQGLWCDLPPQMAPPLVDHHYDANTGAWSDLPPPEGGTLDVDHHTRDFTLLYFIYFIRELHVVRKTELIIHIM